MLESLTQYNIPMGQNTTATGIAESLHFVLWCMDTIHPPY